MFAQLTFLIIHGCSSSHSSPNNIGPKKQDVVVFVIDTLRKDHFEQADTPFLDSVMKEGSYSEHAWAPSTWTAPSVISLFTGKTVREHGWDFPMPKAIQVHNYSYPSIPTETKTIAEVLTDNGFETHGFYSNPLLRREIGFNRGFSNWELSNDLEMTKTLEDFLQNHKLQNQSQFFYIHLLGPHQPLKPSPEMIVKYNINSDRLNDFGGMGLQRVFENKEFISTYQDLYLGVIEDTDKRAKRLFEILEKYLEFLKKVSMQS